MESAKVEYKNPEGYADPTPYDALKRMQRTDADINAMKVDKVYSNAAGY